MNCNCVAVVVVVVVCLLKKDLFEGCALVNQANHCHNSALLSLSVMQ